jgi:hypothetical protein
MERYTYSRTLAIYSIVKVFQTRMFLYESLSIDTHSHSTHHTTLAMDGL